MKYLLILLMGVSVLLFFGGILWGGLTRGKKRVRGGKQVAEELFSEKMSRGAMYNGKPQHRKSFVKGTGVAVEVKAKMSWEEIRLALAQGRFMDVAFVFLTLVGCFGLVASLGCYLILYTSVPKVGWLLIVMTALGIAQVARWLVF